MAGLSSALMFMCFLTVIHADCTETSVDFTFSFNSWDVVGPMDHFWRSTGFCPPDPHQKAADYMLSPDMEQNLAYIGAVPHGGIEQVRIHWLLDLIKVINVTNGLPVYNLTDLDLFITWLNVNGLKPGFEIMGNPSDYFTDFENRTQLFQWKELVTQIANRFIDLFGQDYVESLNFETWNTPDCGRFNMSIQEYLNYYDACSEGLKDASGTLTLGGPGDGCSEISQKYRDALFEHVTSGKNYFTGETGVRMDYISMHMKGSDVAANIVDGEKAFHSFLEQNYPSMVNKTFYNDEADPLKGWNKDEKWRAGAGYAAIVAKIIGQHQNIFKANKSSGINYGLLSNDNGFLSYYPHQFTQRTLLARFQMNNTKDPYVTFVPKPIYSMMAALSKLGDKQVYLKTNGIKGQPLSNFSHYGGIATLHEPEDNTTSDCWQSAFFVYNSCDIGHGENWGLLELDWNIRPPPDNEDLRLMMYGVNPVGGDPYGLWSGLFNSTDYPTLSQFKWMWQQGNPSPMSLPVRANEKTVLLPPNFQILTDTVVVLHLCAKSKHLPEQPFYIRFINITVGQVLVAWSDYYIKTKCIKTYEVEYSTSEKGPFTRVNKDPTIVTATVVAPESKTGETSDDMVRGYYRVRAVDYFDRPGNYSTIAQYTQ